MTLPKNQLFKPTRPEDVCGSLKYSGPPKTIKEMDAGMLAEARRRYASWSKDEDDESGSA
jgi:hypothetical protein